MEELSSKLYEEFLHTEINTEIEVLIKKFKIKEKVKFSNWINQNSVYRSHIMKNEVSKFSICKIYLNKIKVLKNKDIDERFIVFANEKGYNVIKKSPFIEKWIITEYS